VRGPIRARLAAAGAIMALASDPASGDDVIRSSPSELEPRFVAASRPRFSIATTLYPPPEPGDFTFGIRPRINVPLTNKSDRSFWLVARLRPPPPLSEWVRKAHLEPKESFEFEATQDTILAAVDYWLDLTAFADSALTDTLEKSVVQMRFDETDVRAIEKKVAAEREIESGRGPETLEEDGRPIRYHVGLGFGWVVPLGRVSSITDLVPFTEPVPAGDLYVPCPELHIVAGLCAPPWMIEGVIDARVPRLTPAGQDAVDQTRSDGRKVNVEYASFELSGGPALKIESAGRERIMLFAGIGLGLALAQLNAGTGYEPHNETGVGASVKAGVDWSPFRTRHFGLRLAVRQQLFSAGVDIPNDFIVQLAALAMN